MSPVPDKKKKKDFLNKNKKAIIRIKNTQLKKILNCQKNYLPLLSNQTMRPHVKSLCIFPSLFIPANIKTNKNIFKDFL